MMFRWFRPAVAPEETDPAARFVCGVTGCKAGYVTQPGATTTVVECDEHNARTSYDTVEREPKAQQIIRVQDGWRQHATRPPPGR